jgi:hypothetical protein
MATTNYNGKYIAAGGGNLLVHTGAGRLLGMLISSANAAAQTVTFYDNTSATGAVLLAVDLPAGARPFYVRFPRAEAPAFANGLFVVPNNANVTLWAVGH